MRESIQVRKIVVSIVLAGYLVLGVIVYSPSSPMRDTFAQLVKPALAYFGLYYRFWPFEEPRKYTTRFFADVVFSDGSTKTWQFPEATRSDIRNSSNPVKAAWLQHMWDCYYYRFAQVQPLWTEAARYVARQMAGSVEPVSVAIYEDVSPLVCDDATSELPTGRKKLFEYVVKLEDLQ